MKVKITISKELERSLRKQRVLMKFRRNAQKHWGTNPEHRIKSVGGAFIWDDTPEGSTFWLEVERKFIEDKE